MRRLLGILVLFLVLYGTLLALSPAARSLDNQRNIAGRAGFYGVLTLGAGLLIISGGIDLSIGSGATPARSPRLRSLEAPLKSAASG